jgi:hypothetical protein
MGDEKEEHRTNALSVPIQNVPDGVVQHVRAPIRDGGVQVGVDAIA